MKKYTRVINLGVINTKAKPFYCEDYVDFYREEKNNCISIKPNKIVTGELVLNHTCKIILEFCNGKNTIMDIYSKLLSYYNVENNSEIKNRIYNDLIEIIYKYTRLGIVEFKGEEYLFMNQYEKQIKDGYKIQVADERNIEEILDFINHYLKNKNYYDNPLKKVSEYTDVDIRNSLYGYSEEFILVKKEGKIEGIVTVLYSKYENNNIAYIGLIMIDLDLLEDVIEYIKTDLQKLMVNRVSKVKYITTEQNKFNISLSKLIEKMDFKYEGSLEKEIDGMDEHIYSLFF